jgi:hypothetical protein
MSFNYHQYGNNVSNYFSEVYNNNTEFYEIFPNYAQASSYANEVSTFNSIEYYPNYSNSSFYLGSYPLVQSNYFDNNNTIYQQSNPTIKHCPTIYNFFGGDSSTYQELNLSKNNFSKDNYDISTNLTLGISKNTSTVNIGSGSNVKILSPIIENIYDDNDDEKNDIDSDHLIGLEIGEDYTKDYDILDNDFKIEEAQRTDNTLLFTSRTKRHHPVEALNNIESLSLSPSLQHKSHKIL